MSTNVGNVEVLDRENRTEQEIKKDLLYINFFKRGFDIIGGIIGMILLVPISIIVLIMNLVNKENGPLLYSHTRVGKNGKLFKLYKFRTMHVNADKELEELLKKDEKIREEWEQNRKLSNDPRVTKVGKILRKTSLDEIPNFISVIKGDISIVGPRAVVPSELDYFGESKDKILSVKPGITGYWAVNGRSNTTYEERVKMETYYADNISFALDFKILLKTVLQVLKKDGAI